MTRRKQVMLEKAAVRYGMIRVLLVPQRTGLYAIFTSYDIEKRATRTSVNAQKIERLAQTLLVILQPVL